MAEPKYLKQPTKLQPGAWVRFVSDRYASVRGVVGQVTHDDAADNLTVAIPGARSVQAGVMRRDIVLLSADEAAPHIAARTARLVREDDRKAHRAIDVSGRTHFARMARR